MRTWLATCAMLVFGAACGGGEVTPDGGPSDGFVPMDSPSGPCVGASDGTACGTALVCVSGACVASTCGDHVVDSRTEQCDDGNQVAFDGCENDCRFTCENATVCDDAHACNGVETCNTTTHMCQAGTPADNGTTCTEGSITSGVCRDQVCVSAGCGNGVLESGEQCDDGNTTPGDGCELNCTFTCTNSTECDDGNPCNGNETCDQTVPTAPVCAAGTPVTCTPSDACHTSTCDPTAIDPGALCVEALIDGDGDGEAPTSLGPCGTDCNDADPAVNSAAVEICGNGIDDDCNPATVDTATTTYYVDCDLDGFAAGPSGSVAACNMPTTHPCPGSTGGWTTRLPVGLANIDCDDLNANVRPSQASFFTSSYTPSSGGAATFDYNCNMTTSGADTQYGTTAGTTCTLAARPCRPPCTTLDLYCRGTSGWTTAIPACGASSTYQTCPASPAVCRWNGSVQTGCQLVCNPADADCCVPGAAGCNVMGTVRDTFCTPGARGCALTCTPNSRGCTWGYVNCNFTSATRAQGCR